MATQVQIRRGTNTQNASFTGAEGELSANTTNDSVHVHDGSTAGGFELARADLNNVSDTDLNAALTGNTLASLTITSADINGGNIDGTTIGGSTAAAGTFTTFTSNGIDDNASATALTIDSSGRLGVGDTPNTNWRNDATDDVLMLGTEATLHSDAGVTTELWNNAYVNNSDTFKNISTRGASRYMQYSGVHKWFTAASASAGSTISTEINSSPKMVLDVSGNLGIGTDSPSANLEITQSGNNVGLLVAGGGYNYTAKFESSDAEANIIIEDSNSTNDGNMIGVATNDMYFITNASERMRIDSSGNVGINAAGASSATPLQDFQVIHHSGGDRRSTLYYNQDSKVALASLNASSTWENLAIEGATISLKTGGTTNTEALTIDSSGNVDIGSPAGSEKLSVAGSITADGYIYPTTDNGWSLGLSTNRWGNVYAYNGNFESTFVIGPGGGVSQLQIFPAFSSGVNLIQNYSGSAYTTEEHRAYDYNFKIANLSSALFINASGGIYCGTTGTGIGSGNIIVNEGIYIGAANGDNQIRSSSAGGGSATLYIGNAAIQVSSDQRLKTNIVDTEMDATAKLNQVRVVDFNWNDPSDTSFNNRNARGKWTGVLAQELVDVLPFAVNAPRNESDLSIDTDSEQKWLVDQAQMVPVLIKAIQELTTRIEELENN